jgi:F-type H+-transporting ATPase subunit a
MVNAMLTLAEGGSLLDHVLPHEMFHIGPVPITNLTIMAMIAAVLVLLVFGYVSSRIKSAGAMVPKGAFTQLFETLCVFIREEVARPNLGDLTDKYIPYIWTVFFFVLFSNLLGMVPFGAIGQIIGAATGHEHPAHLSHFGGTATSTLTMNAPLALCSLIAILFIGVRENGKHFFAHFAPVPFTLIGMLPIALMLVVLEIMGLIIKCVVLAMRLFGTMLAGHLVLAALLGLIFTAGQVAAAMGYGVGVGILGLGTALSLLELFIAFLQAFIFTFLTVLFIASGAVHHEEHGHDEALHGSADEGGFEREHDRGEPGHRPNATEEAGLAKAAGH